jgi:galactose mutarotase-like enzyme
MTPAYLIELAHLDGFRAWVLRDVSADLQATWVPGAGMLGASLVHRGDELLHTGAGVRGYARERKFMGIPLLHPWANRLAAFAYRAGAHDVVLDRSSPLLLLDDNGRPIHGVLTASRRWNVVAVAVDEDGARLTAVLEFDRPELLAAFPFRHRLEMEVRLGGSALQVRTTLTATGTEAVPVAFGFHPYLTIPGIPRANWEVSLPVHRLLRLDDRMIPTGVSEDVPQITGPIAQRTWDDGFDGVERGSRFELHGGGHAIAVEYTDGYPVAQIFAPPGQHYLCIEPMTAVTNALAGPADGLEWVAAGASRSATFRIICGSDA